MTNTFSQNYKNALINFHYLLYSKPLYAQKVRRMGACVYYSLKLDEKKFMLIFMLFKSHLQSAPKFLLCLFTMVNNIHIVHDKMIVISHQDWCQEGFALKGNFLSRKRNKPIFWNSSDESIQPGTYNLQKMGDLGREWTLTVSSACRKLWVRIQHWRAWGYTSRIPTLENIKAKGSLVHWQCRRECKTTLGYME